MGASLQEIKQFRLVSSTLAHQPALRTHTAKNNKAVYPYSIHIEPFELLSKKPNPALKGKDALQIHNIRQHAKEAEALIAELRSFLGESSTPISAALSLKSELRSANPPDVLTLAAFLLCDLHQRENATTHLRRFYAQEGSEQREVLDCGGEGGQVNPASAGRRCCDTAGLAARLRRRRPAGFSGRSRSDATGSR